MGGFETYLIEMKERESEALRQLPSSLDTLGLFFHAMGLHPQLSWFLINLRKSFLNRKFGGDIDIVAGNYLLDEGRLRPNLEYLVGVEAKCVLLSSNATQIEGGLGSTKSSPADVESIRKQHEALLKLGFNRVFHLDILATPPVNHPVAALGLAEESVRLNRRIFRSRVGKGMPIGQFVWYRAAVMGATEMYRGAGGSKELRRRRNNPYLKSDEGKQQNEFLRSRLAQVFARLPNPQLCPSAFVDCLVCNAIHEIEPYARPCSHRG